MSTPSDDYQIGYRQPPRNTRWKKGQSGNSMKPKPRPRESAVATIEQLLLAPVRLTIDGEPKEVPALEAIVLQLLQKVMAENMRAARVLKKYKEFACQNMERKLDLSFVEGAYTRAVAMLGRDGTE